MKILAINNYSLEECKRKTEDGKMPAHHCWGTDYFERMGNEVDTELFAPKNKGRISYKLALLRYNLSLLFRAHHYDAVIAFANPLLPFVALAKKIGLLRCTRIYAIVHHGAFHWYQDMLSNGYDRLFFISKPVMEHTVNRYPMLASRCQYIEWGGNFRSMRNFINRLSKQRLRSNVS